MTKPRGRPVTISKSEAGDLLRIAAALATVSGGGTARRVDGLQPGDYVLLERIAKDALRPSHRRSNNLDRDLWTTVDYMRSGDRVKVVARRWGWNFTATHARRMKSYAQQTMASNPNANWLLVTRHQMAEYKKRQLQKV